jgi:mannose-6-phosphate isomerase-like protein (cupin superfamily)
MSCIKHIVEETKANTNFRKVLFTGAKSQLVVMDIPVGGEIGEETHEHVEQTLFFLSGSAKAILNDQETAIASGDVVVVTPGTKHNIINTGDVSLKLYTVYAPPNHIDGRIHKTKADADKDKADEAVGHEVE